MQVGRRTVQGTLQENLERILGGPVRADGAGRTDAGVHAIEQVVSIRTTSTMAPDDLRRALNANLPADVAVLRVVDAPAEFHARYSATGRAYRYSIWNAPVRLVVGRHYLYHWRGFLDAAAMDDAARGLVGRHDFAAFSSATRGRERSSGTVRTLFRLHCWRSGDRVLIDAAADAFLPHMVRNLVGTLLPVGMGDGTPAGVQAILASRDRRQAGRTVPAHGLCLTKIWYD